MQSWARSTPPRLRRCKPCKLIISESTWLCGKIILKNYSLNNCILWDFLSRVLGNPISIVLLCFFVLDLAAISIVLHKSLQVTSTCVRFLIVDLSFTICIPFVSAATCCVFYSPGSVSVFCGPWSRVWLSWTGWLWWAC